MRAAVHTFAYNVCDTLDIELLVQPHFCNRSISSVKDFRKVLSSTQHSVPCANGFWHRKFGLEIDQHSMIIAIIGNKRRKTTGFKWNILHNIYSTNGLLCKMKVIDDPMCS